MLDQWRTLQRLVIISIGAAVGLVDTLTCPTVWLPVLCEDQAGMDGLS
jgi:hypothetical protein